MFLANASTRRPIAVSCLLIALIALGFNSCRKLSIENMPAFDIPYIAVITTWVGAAPEDVEKDVSKYIEDAVSGLDGLKHIESSSLENVSQVVLEFDLAINVDTAAQDVREKIDPILTKLPADADRPVIQKININAAPIANIFLSGDAPVDDLYDYAANTIADRFATVPGVAEVQVIGGNEREVWVELNRDALAAAGLTTADITAALQGGILSLPGGRIRDAGNEFTVRFDAEYQQVEDIANLEVANRNGARRRLADLGTVRLATAEIRQRAILDGKQGVLLKVVKKAEGNIVSVVKESRKRFDHIRDTLPGGMELTWVSDESAHITQSLSSAFSGIWQAVMLCAFILFIFLINLRTTLVVAVTMPVTIIISFFFMHLAGQTLNTVTLLAIGLSTGVLVSNSIVVLENIVSKFEVMTDRWEASRQGASEMTVAVLASAGTNVIVMFPIAMMTSMVGRVLAPFAITTLIVNAVSILISFTLTPILCAMLLQPASQRRDNALARFGQRWDRSFQGLARWYANRLRALARSRFFTALTVIGFIVLFFGSMKIAGGRLGFSFFETSDRGRIFIRVETPIYYDLERTIARLEGIQDRLKDLPDLEHVLTSAGKAMSMSGQASEGVYMGQIEMFFKPKTERAWKMSDRLVEIRAMLADEADCLISVSTPGGFGGGQNFQIEQNLSGDDLDVLDQTALRIQAAARDLPGVDMLETTVRDTKPEIRVLPKRPVLADLGLPAARLATVVRANIEGLKAANYKRGDRTYDIRVKLAEESGKEQIRQFLLPGADGRPIPLETVADVVDTQSKIQIYRVDKQRTVKILGDIKPGATMSAVGSSIAQTIADEKLLPVGYTLGRTGMSERMDEALADFREALVLAAFLTLLTLAAIMESWTRPGWILLTLPMGLIGVVWALMLSHSAITILVLLGTLMLIGVVVNAAILILDKMAQHLKAGVSRREAMLTALEEEFRPVLMVVLASGLGMLPIALSRGIGSESRAGIGIASVGGIIVAGILTLTALPMIYTLFTGRPKATNSQPLPPPPKA
ncbi:MAG TPA: efflux RND transporter permease subunit [Kiritimatiellia bacterium]|nr:efflux RND transporter permease subunit [Kiritimatiellia bacterium]HOR74753.1 efflux RND transporter permease subunit [Kiritimatiellia bacterium]HOU59238.1 efflux RND transporter permease subunit [Kiritimatiellia bacterium]HPK69686.1 efflux RND transporter permease subunit [Kiritimatiellia bacterium]HQK44660.1 efflux RND transporter permease subunit [Kiritimatiellia bacterium]